ncbi:hypothetical protein MMC13_008162 [Lambiella insularis]|nr:hypothetical protein [Lambiella insularis]
MPLPPCSSDSCPFCAIASAYPPSASVSPPLVPTSTSPTTTQPGFPLARILLSTPDLVAFLDHAPISRGHVLIATRQHREKLSDVSVDEGRALGAWMGILCRAVVKTVLSAEGGTKAKEGQTGTAEDELGDWNVVQNNGTRIVPDPKFKKWRRVY